MSRWILLVIRASLMLISLWFAFMMPRWLDSSFYDLCPSLNCFRPGSTYFVFLAFGLALGIALNVFLTLSSRSRLPSTANDS